MNLEIFEIFEITRLPLHYIYAVLTGYVLASLLAGETSFWKNRESFEKLVIGGALGLGLFFGQPFPLSYYHPCGYH